MSTAKSSGVHVADQLRAYVSAQVNNLNECWCDRGQAIKHTLSTQEELTAQCSFTV